MIKGVLTPPGDKSISHRAALFSALRNGRSQFTNFPASGDCLATLHCLARLGIDHRLEGENLVLSGRNRGDWRPPEKPLDAANSGTTMRLLSGILAAQPFSSTISGDEHLQKRPMKRIIDPLRQMGASIQGEQDRFPPLRFEPVAQLNAIRYELPVASAQVKSCVLLAGLFAEGQTVVVEKESSRDHTERMLSLPVLEKENGNRQIISHSAVEIPDLSMAVPGDISSAAFFIAAALLVPGSELQIRNVSLNPTRTAFLDVVRNMGAGLEIERVTDKPEPAGNILVRYSKLVNKPVREDLIANLIDEIPILSLLASQADGEFELHGIQELRVKESDRIEAICSNLKNLGVAIEEFDDGFKIKGPQKLRGGRINCFGDHRIAMTFGIAGLSADGPVEIDSPSVAAVSFPDFWNELKRLSS